MKSKAIAIGIALLGGVASATATSLDGAGFTVTYTLASQGLFAGPGSLPRVLAGVDLRWRPNSFAANSDVGNLSSTTEVIITAKTGYDLSSFKLDETGLFLTGVYGVGSFSASIQYAASVSVLDPAGGSQAILTGTPPLTDTNLNTANWFAPPSNFSVSPGTKQVKFELTNTLMASASGDAYAELRKTQVDLTITATALAVHEPESYAMMLAGLGALGFLASRRRPG